MPLRAQTNVYMKLGAGANSVQEIPLEIEPFRPVNGQIKSLAREASVLQSVLRSDLMISRYFEIIEKGPPAARYRLSASVSSGTARGEITLEASLDSTQEHSAVFRRPYKAPSSKLRDLAHALSDDVISALTGRKGIASTRIAFANNSTGHREIYIADYDGADLRRLTHDKSLDLIPRFDPIAPRLAYTSYKAKNPDLYSLDLATGRARLLSGIQGLNVAGGFSPDGTRLVMTVSGGQNPSIYLKDLKNGRLTRLTRAWGADSSPTFSPDGNMIAYVSDVPGNPQIYVMNLLTGRKTMLTHLNWCDSPSWSPGGEWIAFAGRVHSEDPMDVFLVDLSGTQLRRLTNGEGANEDPRWSADGRFIAFSSTRGGKAQIYVMDSDGSAPHLLVKMPGSSITPDWSR